MSRIQPCSWIAQAQIELICIKLYHSSRLDHELLSLTADV